MSQDTIYNEFINKIKTKFKKDKQQRKQNLRQIAQRRLVESEQESHEEQFVKKTGNKWWGRINRHYFLRINRDYFENFKHLTMTDDIKQFGLSHSILLHFYQQIVYVPQDNIFVDDSIRVLYRLQDKLKHSQIHILAGYILKNKTTPKPQTLKNNPYNIPKLYSFHQIPQQQQKQFFNQQLEQISIQLIGYTQDEKYIKKCLQYEDIWRKQNFDQIDKEIQCWKLQLQTQHHINYKKWQIIEQRWQKQRILYPQMKDMDQKIEEIKKQLIHCQTFLYFRIGYSDKTTQDLSMALSQVMESQGQLAQDSKYIQKNNYTKQYNKDFFETDCKVCFCTKNQVSNKVIYCDSCNTSFHQSCYGIEIIDETKQLICDVCAYIRKYQIQNRGQKCEIITCQICAVSKFPIKNINGHFYHISCLILFNFANIHEFTLSMKAGVTHSQIMEQVIENQMDNDYCQYCINNMYTGMKLRCTYQLCSKVYHPICAYLNGCIFTMKRKSTRDGIQVNVQCREHSYSDFGDQALQVYIRRYLCNYRQTVQIGDNDFRDNYEKQLQKTSNSPKRGEFKESGVQRIFRIRKNKPVKVEIERKRTEYLKKIQSSENIRENSATKTKESKDGKLRKKSCSKDKLKQYDEL